MPQKLKKAPSGAWVHGIVPAFWVRYSNLIATFDERACSITRNHLCIFRSLQVLRPDDHASVASTLFHFSDAILFLILFHSVPTNRSRARRPNSMSRQQPPHRPFYLSFAWLGIPLKLCPRKPGRQNIEFELAFSSSRQYQWIIPCEETSNTAQFRSMGLWRRSPSCDAFSGNGTDDRAVAGKFSIRKRPIHRFGPSD